MALAESGILKNLIPNADAEHFKSLMKDFHATILHL